MNNSIFNSNLINEYKKYEDIISQLKETSLKASMAITQAQLNEFEAQLNEFEAQYKEFYKEHKENKND